MSSESIVYLDTELYKGPRWKTAKPSSVGVPLSPLSSRSRGIRWLSLPISLAGTIHDAMETFSAGRGDVFVLEFEDLRRATRQNGIGVRLLAGVHVTHHM